VKDAKLDLEATSWVLARTDLAYYSGHDPWTLPLLSIGAVGVVGTSTHSAPAPRGAGRRVRLRRRRAAPASTTGACCPLYSGIFRAQGTILVKAALRELGLPAGPVRLPLVDATPDQVPSCATTSRAPV
jgi:4-hydroxy-tetrahydrodipicolinate synthase